jgi:ATP-binding cassette subfamily C protein
MADVAQGETARSLGMQEALVQRQLRQRQTMSEAVNTSTRSSAGYSASTKFTRLVLQSAALALGAFLALKQDISAGGIIASSILTSRAYAPLELIVGAWRQFEQGRSAYRVVNDVLKATENPREYTTLPAPRGELTLEQVGVKSPGGERILLYGANFKVPAGEIVGVIGPSGAGKTTLIRTVAGAILPDTGAVRLDGAKLTDWPSDTLGRHIGYLPQDVGLFSGTIAENISRFDTGDPAIVDRAIVDAAKAAGVHELILALPKGYDTEIGANGRGLSAGQAQRVALARALYGDPVLIVLDEPNAHLDADGENALITTLKAARDRGATSVVVAHRTGFMNIADKLVVVNDGRIEAYGPREQIVARMQSGGQGPRPVVVSSTEQPQGRRP